MTLPDERTRSIICTRDFLYRLLDPQQTPRVPREIRRQAAMCLRHFPYAYEFAKVCKKLPELFGPYPKEK